MADDRDCKLSPPPVAIVGMAMRLPAGVNNSGAFWDLLVSGRDGRCRVPGDRYNADAFLSAKPATGNAKSRAIGMQYGYFLQEDILQYLDASFFSMDKAEVEKLDPQQRLMLEVVWECLENAGQTGWRGKDTGFYVGVFGEDWLDLYAKDAQERGVHRITGPGDFALANRMSYEYDFKGPRYVNLRRR
ncbi:putative PKS/NRPS-like protein biosynthetic cluster [Trichoglossum hirsutum]|uniref:PKS/NRPS-like protein biosynthetic cluster n=1 Tax=Trichoglossum hirsutum TaxID=265104 RepID=A0A9P8RT14_9PEZI|nr:putative PKS/NRPS-like protein biosynthetic cluster [Trichoglossum hirsutum]